MDNSFDPNAPGQAIVTKFFKDYPLFADKLERAVAKASEEPEPVSAIMLRLRKRLDRFCRENPGEPIEKIEVWLSLIAEYSYMRIYFYGSHDKFLRCFGDIKRNPNHQLAQLVEQFNGVGDGYRPSFATLKRGEDFDVFIPR